MDATRLRRTKDRIRQMWYAAARQRRFARHMGFACAETVTVPARILTLERAKDEATWQIAQAL